MKLYLARNSKEYFNSLKLFLYKPIKDPDFPGTWEPELDNYLYLNDNEFSEVTYENSPVEVELRIINRV